MKRKNTCYRLLIALLLMASAFPAYSQSSSDTTGRSRYVTKATGDLGISEQQAVLLRQAVLSTRERIAKLQKDSTLSPFQKQKQIQSVLLAGEQNRYTLLSASQKQKLKTLLKVKLPAPDKQQAQVKANLESLKHPVKGGAFKSIRTINEPIR